MLKLSLAQTANTPWSSKTYHQEINAQWRKAFLNRPAGVWAVENCSSQSLAENCSSQAWLKLQIVKIKYILVFQDFPEGNSENNVCLLFLSSWPVNGKSGKSFPVQNPQTGLSIGPQSVSVGERSGENGDSPNTLHSPVSNLQQFS